MLALAEVVATSGDLRSRINQKYRFDERMRDLTQCLLLDGYIIQDKKLVQTDPSIADAAPLEDDLIDALENSGMPRAQAIIANARHVILVADATKFERTAPVRIGHLSQVNTFITDRCDIESVRRICTESEVRLLETTRAPHLA